MAQWALPIEPYVNFAYCEQPGISMIEKPLESVLGREDSSKALEKHCAPQLSLLRDLADYGTNLVLRAYNSSAKGLEDGISCGVLLKQVVAMIDAIQTLASSGLVHAAFLPARTAFEASIYLDWMLFSDSEKKARTYLVGNYRDARRWARRAIRGTAEAAAFEQITNGLGLDIHLNRPTLASDAAAQLAEIDRILSQPELVIIDSQFDIAKGNKKHDPHWYQVLGVKSIRELSSSVGRLPEYEVFYGKGSQVTHSASYRDHLKFSENEVTFKQVRNLEGFHLLMHATVTNALRTYQDILKKYRPGELPAFSRKYVEDWRDPFFSTKQFEYK
jgi:hypothetical protein